MSEGAQGAPDTRQVEHLGPGESPVGSRGDRQAGRRVALRLDTVPCPELPGQGAWGRSPAIRLGNCAGWKAFPRARVLARVPRDPAWAPGVVQGVGGHSPKVLEKGRPGSAHEALRPATKSEPC